MILVRFRGWGAFCDEAIFFYRDFTPVWTNPRLTTLLSAIIPNSGSLLITSLGIVDPLLTHTLFSANL